MKDYYERRATEYDATTYELAREDPATAGDLAELERLLASHEPGRVLDIGCGTGRVAAELVLVEQAWQSDLPRESWEQRRLTDGSKHLVFKRYFTAGDLAAELGGDVLLATPTFVAVAVRR